MLQMKNGQGTVVIKETAIFIKFDWMHWHENECIIKKQKGTRTSSKHACKRNYTLHFFLHFRGTNHIAGSRFSIGKAGVYSKEQDKKKLASMIYQDKKNTARPAQHEWK